jgi:hypothetical protein
MRRLGGTVLGAAALLLAVACGQQQDVGFGGQPPSSGEPGKQPVSTRAIPPTPAPDPANPAPPPGAQSVAAPKVDAGGLPEGYPRAAWTEGDGTVVGAYGVASGGCVEVRGELAEQNAQRVVLRLVEVTTSTGPCTMEIRYLPVTVKLASPLADRTVVLQRTVG